MIETMIKLYLFNRIIRVKESEIYLCDLLKRPLWFLYVNLLVPPLEI